MSPHGGCVLLASDLQLASEAFRSQRTFTQLQASLFSIAAVDGSGGAPGQPSNQASSTAILNDQL